MTERVDARDVMDANARTRRTFRGRIVGHFERTGPDSWNDYEFVRAGEGEIEVSPGLEVQLERAGAVIRMRSEGRVIRVAWIPSDEEQAEIEAEGPAGARRRFLATRVAEEQGEQAIGAAAVIVRKLTDE
jgi:hypothetical protein